MIEQTEKPNSGEQIVSAFQFMEAITKQLDTLMDELKSQLEVPRPSWNVKVSGEDYRHVTKRRWLTRSQSLLFNLEPSKVVTKKSQTVSIQCGFQVSLAPSGSPENRFYPHVATLLWGYEGVDGALIACEDEFRLDFNAMEKSGWKEDKVGMPGCRWEKCRNHNGDGDRPDSLAIALVTPLSLINNTGDINQLLIEPLFEEADNILWDKAK